MWLEIIRNLDRLTTIRKVNSNICYMRKFKIKQKAKREEPTANPKSHTPSYIYDLTLSVLQWRSSPF